MKLSEKFFFSAFIVLLFTISVIGQQKPNFIVILVDDMGFGDIGAYRNLYEGEDSKSISHLHTPELDKLAQNGILCTRAYATSWCAPSRQMLLSGCWVNRDSSSDPEFPWIGSRLRKEGYTTGMIGKVHSEHAIARCSLFYNDEQTEFDQGLFMRGGMRDFYMKSGEVLPGHNFEKDASYEAEENEYITDIFNDQAVDFIKRNSDRPFFLYLAHTAPHSPIQAKPEDLKKLFPDVFGDMDDDQLRAKAAPPGVTPVEWTRYRYAAMVYSVDRGLGDLKCALKESDVDKNTVIIFAGDNGAIVGSNHPYSGHKWDVYEGGIRVPFIVWSDAISNSDKKGSVYDGLVSLADVTPTLLAMIGKKDLDEFDGIDMMPYLTGSKTTPPANKTFYYRGGLGYNQVTGADKLYPKGTKHILLESYIQQDRKYLRFRGSNDQVYERGFALPDVSGVVDPQIKLAEDIQGLSSGDWTKLSVEAAALLKKEYDDFMEANEQDFSLTWKGHAPPRWKGEVPVRKNK